MTTDKKRRRWLALVPGLVLGVCALTWAGGTAADPDAGVPDGGTAPVAAEPTAEPEEGGEWEGPAVNVTVGIYINQMKEVSLRDNEFQVDFWIWFRWPKGSPEIDPLDSFEIIGGAEVAKESEIHEDLGDALYAACRVRATITKFFDVRAFPKDSHQVAIVIEDSEHEDHEIRYIADRSNTRIDPDVQVPGFVIANSGTVVGRHTYRSNYGDTTLPSNNASAYSRFEVRVNLARPGLGYSLKLLWGLWLSAMIAFIAMFIKVTDVDPRFGLGVGAIFAAMANAYIISSALPDTNQVTTADLVNMLTIAFIFLSLLESVISLWLFQAERETLSKRIDKIAFFTFVVAYAGLTLLAMQ